MSEELKPTFYVIDVGDIGALKHDIRDQAFLSLLEKGYTLGPNMLMVDEDQNGRERKKLGVILIPPGPPGDGAVICQEIDLARKQMEEHRRAITAKLNHGLLLMGLMLVAMLAMLVTGIHG